MGFAAYGALHAADAKPKGPLGGSGQSGSSSRGRADTQDLIAGTFSGGLLSFFYM